VHLLHSLPDTFAAMRTIEQTSQPPPSSSALATPDQPPARHAGRLHTVETDRLTTPQPQVKHPQWRLP
jgi:hypothetical protein